MLTPCSEDSRVLVGGPDGYRVQQGGAVGPLRPYPPLEPSAADNPDVIARAFLALCKRTGTDVSEAIAAVLKTSA